MLKCLPLAIVALLAASSGAGAQTACSTQSKTVLLGQFSDNVAPDSITPQAVRNVICSSQLLVTAGGAAVPQALFGSPTIIIAASYGSLTVSNGKVEVSRNGGTTFYSWSLTGGAIPLMATDQVKVTWFGATAPVVVFYPNGS